MVNVYTEAWTWTSKMIRFFSPSFRNECSFLFSRFVLLYFWSCMPFRCFHRVIIIVHCLLCVEFFSKIRIKLWKRRKTLKRANTKVYVLHWKVKAYKSAWTDWTLQVSSYSDCKNHRWWVQRITVVSNFISNRIKCYLVQWFIYCILFLLSPLDFFLFSFVEYCSKNAIHSVSLARHWCCLCILEYFKVN